MLQPYNILFNKILRLASAMVMVFAISATVYAIDGIVMKSKSSKSSFSNMKKHLSLSLRDGFSYRDNKAFGYKRHGNMVMFNNVITYQKGNVTYIIPYKNRVVLNKFKTPTKPQQ